MFVFISDNEENGETNQLLESQTYKSDGRLYHASKGKIRIGLIFFAILYSVTKYHIWSE